MIAEQNEIADESARLRIETQRMINLSRAERAMIDRLIRAGLSLVARSEQHPHAQSLPSQDLRTTAPNMR